MKPTMIIPLAALVLAVAAPITSVGAETSSSTENQCSSVPQEVINLSPLTKERFEQVKKYALNSSDEALKRWSFLSYDSYIHGYENQVEKYYYPLISTRCEHTGDFMNKISFYESIARNIDDPRYAKDYSLYYKDLEYDAICEPRFYYRYVIGYLNDFRKTNDLCKTDDV